MRFPLLPARRPRGGHGMGRRNDGDERPRVLTEGSSFGWSMGPNFSPEIFITNLASIHEYTFNMAFPFSTPYSVVRKVEWGDQSHPRDQKIKKFWWKFAQIVLIIFLKIFRNLTENILKFIFYYFSKNLWQTREILRKITVCLRYIQWKFSELSSKLPYYSKYLQSFS